LRADIVIPTIEEEKNGFTDTDEVEENESVASINQSQAEPQENIIIRNLIKHIICIKNRKHTCRNNHYKKNYYN